MKTKSERVFDINVVKEFPFFSDFTNIQTTKIFDRAMHVTFDKDEFLYNMGTDERSGLFIVIHGSIDFFETNKNKGFDRAKDGDVFNVLSIFYDSRRFNNAIASEDSYLLFIKKSDLIKLSDNDKSLKIILYKKSSQSYDIVKLREIIRKVYGGSITYTALRRYA